MVTAEEILKDWEQHLKDNVASTLGPPDPFWERVWEEWLAFRMEYVEVK